MNGYNVQMLFAIIQVIVAGVVALFGVATLGVAVDLLKNGSYEISRYRDPKNWETVLVGMWVDKDGVMRYKTKRVYIGNRNRL